MPRRAKIKVLFEATKEEGVRVVVLVNTRN
jgi:hypothetical protein